jgi:hypothetical protein
MEIIIDYESSWRNSFLDGSNSEPLPKNGRNFIASMSELKKEGNYIKRDVTKDTVMGILNRLIGDQRKLYQARYGQYFFKDIEPLVEFDDRKKETGEIVYIRNMNGSTDQNSFSGMIKADEPMFKSEYSNELWSVLKSSFDELCQFILEEDFGLQLSRSFDPLQICAIFDELGKLKPVPNEKTTLAVIERLSGIYPDESYLNNKGLVIPSMVYCAALYIQLERLSHKYDVSSARTKSGGLSGISKRSFTKKDFMKRFTTGNGKIIWGNPYMKKEKIKGLGEVTSTLTKANGQLYITLNVDREKGMEIKQMIENAGVSSFYLGKKGLAYVSSIRV